MVSELVLLRNMWVEFEQARSRLRVGDGPGRRYVPLQIVPLLSETMRGVQPTSSNTTYEGRPPRCTLYWQLRVYPIVAKGGQGPGSASANATLLRPCIGIGLQVSYLTSIVRLMVIGRPNTCQRRVGRPSSQSAPPCTVFSNRGRA